MAVKTVQGLQQSVLLLYSGEQKDRRRREINREKDLLVIALISLLTIMAECWMGIEYIDIKRRESDWENNMCSTPGPQ